MKSKIFVLSYFFHPFGGQASYWRTRTIAKLASRGWHVTVLRVCNDPYLKHISDGEVNFPDTLTIKTTRCFNLSAVVDRLRGVEFGKVPPSRMKRGRGRRTGPARSFSATLKRTLLMVWLLANFPDGRLVWLFSSIVVGLSNALRERPTVIYSICNPQSNVVSGLVLSVLLRVPLVIEYKDAWTVDGNIFTGKPCLHRALGRWLEGRALARSCCLIGVTEGLIRKYEEVYPVESGSKWELITHGYDIEDIERYLKPLREWSRPLKLVYAATRLQNMSYDIKNLLRAIKKVNENGRRVELACYGHPSGADAFARGLGLDGETVMFHGPREKTVVWEANQASDSLVVVLNETQWNMKKYTSKLFDLFAHRRPLLACVPPGGAADGIIRRLRVGVSVSNEDPAAIAEAIARLHDEAERGSLEAVYSLGPKVEFERNRLVDKLERCLESAMGDTVRKTRVG